MNALSYLRHPRNPRWASASLVAAVRHWMSAEDAAGMGLRRGRCWREGTQWAAGAEEPHFGTARGWGVINRGTYVAPLAVKSRDEKVMWPGLGGRRSLQAGPSDHTPRDV